MDHDTPGEPAAPTARVGLGGRLTALVSYALFAVGIAALASFFAPYLGLAKFAWHSAYLPTIAAPTEGDAVVDVAPLLVGTVLAAVATWLR
jgi:hypothetical protein